MQKILGKDENENKLSTDAEDIAKMVQLDN